MNIVSAEQDNIDMMLTQMGAKVKSIHGLVCFVRFDINGTEIFYVYNVNAKDQYYLQKVLPYPVGAGVFTKPCEIVDYIKKDITLYKTAVKSSLFNSFTKVNLELHQIIHKMEETFMNYNVSDDMMTNVWKQLEQLNKTMDEIQHTSEKVVHDDLKK
ncbi:MAG: hypothetical protein K0S41_1740 [Anaerocolumna sp.]|jgi:hypothetical protein|nr:hypothetical protein [Anaerocolumna sp.]